MTQCVHSSSEHVCEQPLQSENVESSRRTEIERIVDHRGFPHVESLGQFVDLIQAHVAPFFVNSGRFLAFGYIDSTTWIAVFSSAVTMPNFMIASPH